MAKYAELPDGTRLEFPDDVKDSVMDMVVAQHMSSMVTPQAQAQPQPQQASSFADMVARSLGLGGRAAMQGVLDIADVVASPARYGLNKINEALGGAPDYFKPTAEAIPEGLGLPEPQTPQERIVGAGIRGAAGAIPTLGAGAALQAAGRAPAIAEALTAMPKLQGVSGFTGGAAMGGAQEAEVGPAGQILAGIAGGMSPMAAGLAGRGLKNVIAQGLINPEKAAAWQAAGVAPPSLGTVSDSGSVQALEAGLRQLLPSAGVMKRAQEAGNVALQNVVEDTAARMARGGAVPQSLEEMGAVASAGAASGKKAFLQQARQFEGTTYEPIGQFSAELTNVMQYIEDTAAKLSPAMRDAFRENMLRELGSVVDDASKGALNVESLRRFGKLINRKIESPPTATTADVVQGELQQLSAAAKRDIEAALPPNELAQVREYNKWYTQQKDIRDEVERVFFAKRDSTATAKAILTADADQLNMLRSAVGDAEFDRLRAGALQELSRGPQGASPAYTAKALGGGRGGLQQPAQQALFGGEEAQARAIAQALAESRNAMNTSNTAGANAVAQLLGMGAGGVLNLPLTAIGASVPYGVSRAVTSPKNIERLITRALNPLQVSPAMLAAPAANVIQQAQEPFEAMLERYGITAQPKRGR